MNTERPTRRKVTGRIREHGCWSVRREMSWNVEEVMCLTVVKGNMAAGVLEGRCHGTWRR